jgi:hypothetical protein
MAAEPGFEPGQKDSKSFVLPLHNSAPNTGVSWCRRSGSNRHESCPSTVFETVASAYSATPARKLSGYQCATRGAEAQDRTGDTRIFSPLLYLAELPRHDLLLYLLVGLSVNIAPRKQELKTTRYYLSAGFCLFLPLMRSKPGSERFRVPAK